jgi:hypothetical protein
MNIINVKKRVLRKINNLELSILINVDTYTNRDHTETKLIPIQYIMSGGKYGDHSISAESSPTRVSVHWKGYLIANGIDVRSLKVKDVYLN